MKINDKQRKRIYGLITDTGAEKEAVLIHCTGKSKLTDLSYLEANLVIKKLLEIQESAREKMRGKIIYHLCTAMKMTDDKGNADYNRINNFIKEIGSRNPKKKKLYNLNVGEMRNVLNQVEMMSKKELRR